jgi:hypothetical protein
MDLAPDFISWIARTNRNSAATRLSALVRKTFQPLGLWNDDRAAERPSRRRSAPARLTTRPRAPADSPTVAVVAFSVLSLGFRSSDKLVPRGR